MIRLLIKDCLRRAVRKAEITIAGIDKDAEGLMHQNEPIGRRTSVLALASTAGAKSLASPLQEDSRDSDFGVLGQARSREVPRKIAGEFGGERHRALTEAVTDLIKLKDLAREAAALGDQTITEKPRTKVLHTETVLGIQGDKGGGSPWIEPRLTESSKELVPRNGACGRKTVGAGARILNCGRRNPLALEGTPRYLFLQTGEGISFVTLSEVVD